MVDGSLAKTVGQLCFSCFFLRSEMTVLLHCTAKTVILFPHSVLFRYIIIVGFLPVSQYVFTVLLISTRRTDVLL